MLTTMKPASGTTYDKKSLIVWILISVKSKSRIQLLLRLRFIIISNSVVLLAVWNWNCRQERDFLSYVYDAIKQSFIFEWASYRIHSLLKEPAPYRLLVAGMVLSHWLLVAGMMHDAVTPAPSSRYDAGSSEQVFCTWLIREWNFAYLHPIHTRESPSEYSEGRYWSNLMYVVLKFLCCLQFQYQTVSIRKVLGQWCRITIHDHVSEW